LLRIGRRRACARGNVCDADGIGNGRRERERGAQRYSVT
jgi:hypothetical protein